MFAWGEQGAACGVCVPGVFVRVGICIWVGGWERWSDERGDTKNPKVVLESFPQIGHVTQEFL